MLTRIIDGTHVRRGSVALWWLGQSGFAIKGENVVVYLDPYLSTRLERLTAASPETRHVRLCEIPVTPAAVTNAGYVICSHDHGDHMDPDTLIPVSQASPGARFIVPRAARDIFGSLGISPERVIFADADAPQDLGTIWYRAVPGKHNEFDWKKSYGYRYLGFIIRVNEVTIYHAGDTLMYSGLIERLVQYDIDVALLPINGGDPGRVNRGFMSNLNYREAADLGATIGAKLIIPTHYGMFEVNNERVENFTEYISATYPKHKYKIMELATKFVFSRA